MVEHAVDYDLDAPFVCFLDKIGKEPVGCLKIGLVRHPADIAGCVFVLGMCPIEKISLVVHDLSEMGVYVVIVLNIIFMIGGRDKQGVKVYGTIPRS